MRRSPLFHPLKTFSDRLNMALGADATVPFGSTSWRLGRTLTLLLSIVVTAVLITGLALLQHHLWPTVSTQWLWKSLVVAIVLRLIVEAWLLWRGR